MTHHPAQFLQLALGSCIQSETGCRFVWKLLEEGACRSHQWELPRASLAKQDCRTRHLQAASVWKLMCCTVSAVQDALICLGNLWSTLLLWATLLLCYHVLIQRYCKLSYSSLIQDLVSPTGNFQPIRECSRVITTLGTAARSGYIQ